MTGVYTQITEIVAPGSAVTGETVSVKVKIKNLYSSIIGIMVGGALDYGVSPWPGINFPDSIANVAAGAIHTFNGSFTMPNSAVTIHAYSYYYSPDTGYWYFDDEKTKGVSLAEVVAGKIVDKWVNKAPEGNRLVMPASVKADGNTFEVGVSYRNDSSVNITGGAEVKVTKPDGSVVAPAIDWSGIGIGQTLIKQYNIAAVNQVGNWTIVIRFLTQSMQVLDTFSGTCLIAQVVLVPTFSNFGVKTFSKA